MVTLRPGHVAGKADRVTLIINLFAAGLLATGVVLSVGVIWRKIEDRMRGKDPDDGRLL